MEPVAKQAVGPVGKKPGCLGPAAGAGGLLLAAVSGTVGLLSLGSDPIVALAALLIASLGGVLFGRALIADRRRREVERSTIHRRSAAQGDPGTTRYVDGPTPPRDPIAIALRSFLDDPDRLAYLDIDGPRSFRLRFALLSTDPNVLRGEATSLSRLDPRDHPGPDTKHGLAALGWAAPPPLSRQDFAAEWSLPVDLAGLSAFVLSTARIYKVEAPQLRPQFGNPHAATDQPASARPDIPVEGGSAGAPTTRGLGAFLRGLTRHPAVVWASFAIGVVALIAGPDRMEGFIRSLPAGLLYGVFGIVLLWTGVPFLARYRRTSDPFSLTGWDKWRGRTRTTYASHIWWGVFGTVGVVGGIALLILAVNELV